MLRRILLTAVLAAAPAFAADAPKVFRYAFEIAETSFDPHFISDVYSNIVNMGMYEAPLAYDYLARPMKLKPQTAAAMPEVSADGTTYTVRIKPGIFFADDAAFNGKKRELTAADYVYSMKRLLDPRVRASQQAEIEPYVLGAEAAATKARKANTFDYDAPIEGLKLLDRYTFQVKLNQPLFVFIYVFADCRIACAVAREVVEKYGADFGAHPVGTGPWKLAFWKRGSKMTFERNPAFREETWDAQPNPDDARGQEIAAMFKGRRVPMLDRIELSIIEETQPRWLSFLNEEMDLIFLVPEEFGYQAFPNRKVAANLARRGIEMHQIPALDLTFNFFNMRDPVVGGYTPEKVALRRAISLSYKTADEIAVIRKGQAIPAQTPYSPGVIGYDPNFRTNANEYNVPKARALLDMFGYVDRNGDGFRELPDGSPLVIDFYSTPTARDQQFDELWKRSLDDIGIRMNVIKRKWPDILKAARQSKIQFWQLGNSATTPDADGSLASLYGPNLEGNLAKFSLKEYDALFERARRLPDSPERTQLYNEMTKLVIAYAPWRVNTHRIRTDMWYPPVKGYVKSPLTNYNFWKYIDIQR
ncbi:MAG TPA: ABC transporter substrate-binding protein [Usitatibacter sp.]|nr:ABC transporter substrate-binding protein [Usitatibacter sp.]